MASRRACSRRAWRSSGGCWLTHLRKCLQCRQRAAAKCGPLPGLRVGVWVVPHPWQGSGGVLKTLSVLYSMGAFRLWRLSSAEAYALVNSARACVFLGPESKGTGESKRRAKAWAICTIDTRRLESLYLYGRGGTGAYETCPAEGVAHFRARTRKRVLQTPCLTQLSQLLQRPSLDPVAPPVVIVHVPQAVPDNRAAVG